MLKLRVLVAMLVTVLALGLAACGGDDDDDSGSDSGSSGQTAKPKAGTLELWVGGNFAGATPGTPYRKWLDSQIDRFKAENKGSDVKMNGVLVGFGAGVGDGVGVGVGVGGAVGVLAQAAGFGHAAAA